MPISTAKSNANSGSFYWEINFATFSDLLTNYLCGIGYYILLFILSLFTTVISFLKRNSYVSKFYLMTARSLPFCSQQKNSRPLEYNIENINVQEAKIHMKKNLNMYLVQEFLIIFKQMSLSFISQLNCGPRLHRSN